MSLYYFDASAIVKYYVTEPGSLWITSLVEAKDTNSGAPLHSVFVGSVSIAEVAAAFSVLYRQRIISRKQRNDAFAHFLADLEDRFVLVTTSTERFYEAAGLTKSHPLKAYDAVQLAIVLNYKSLVATHGLNLTFVCGDNTLLNAAQVEQMTVENPFDHIVPEDQM